MRERISLISGSETRNTILISFLRTYGALINVIKPGPPLASKDQREKRVTEESVAESES